MESSGMTAAPTRQHEAPEESLEDIFEVDADRADDHVIRQLLLEEPIDPVPETAPEPAKATRPRGGSARIAAPIFGFLLAIVLAGGSLVLATGWDVEAPSPAVLPAPTPSPSADQPSELVLLVAPASGSDADEMADVRRQVLARGGALEQDEYGVVRGVRIAGEELGALFEELESSDGIRIIIAGDAPPDLSKGEDWQEWSRRLQLRRAIRRAERSADPVRLEVRTTG